MSVSKSVLYCRCLKTVFMKTKLKEIWRLLPVCHHRYLYMKQGKHAGGTLWALVPSKLSKETNTPKLLFFFTRFIFIFSLLDKHFWDLKLKFYQALGDTNGIYNVAFKIGTVLYLNNTSSVLTFVSSSGLKSTVCECGICEEMYLPNWTSFPCKAPPKMILSYSWLAASQLQNMW